MPRHTCEVFGTSRPRYPSTTGAMTARSSVPEFWDHIAKCIGLRQSARAVLRRFCQAAPCRQQEPDGVPIANSEINLSVFAGILRFGMCDRAPEHVWILGRSCCRRLWKRSQNSRHVRAGRCFQNIPTMTASSCHRYQLHGVTEYLSDKPPRCCLKLRPEPLAQVWDHWSSRIPALKMSAYSSWVFRPTCLVDGSSRSVSRQALSRPGPAPRTGAIQCGWRVFLRYGSTDSNPPNRLLASSLDTAGVIITSSP